MASEPSSNPDGSALPPRHRPSMGDLVKDTTEMDLWDFDDLDTPAGPSSLPAKRPPKSASVELVEESGPSDSSLQSSRPEPSSPKPRQIRTSTVRRNLPGKGTPRTATPEPDPTPVPTTRKVENDFEELEHWDDLPEIAPKAKPVAKATPKQNQPDSPQPDKTLPDERVSESELETLTSIDSPASSSPGTSLMDEGLSPAVRSDLVPVSLRPRLGLNQSERIGLIALVVILAVGGVFFLTQSIQRLPTESVKLRPQDFPIEGTRVQVEAASTFWREPGDSDVVRRGTALVPAAEISVSGGQGAVRVFFLNEQGERVGDPVNRQINGKTRLTFSATAGFEDLSMHAAYRTGETKPWSILVLEGESTNAPGEAFKKLFEMSISTDRR